MSQCYVYALVDPINKVPFYIGKGQNKRAWDHTKGYDKRNSKKVRYIDNIRSLGFEPEVHIVKENMDNVSARDFEKTCIVYGKEIGLPLTNVRLDEGTHNWSAESRKKLSDTWKRKIENGYVFGSRKGRKWGMTKAAKLDKLKRGSRYYPVLKGEN